MFRANLTAFLPATCFVISSSNQVEKALAADPRLAELVARNRVAFASSSPVPVTTDDWPYLYQEGRWIPRTYFSVALLVILLGLALYWQIPEARGSTPSLFFLSMGAGFLLLETQAISRLALYFGTTWLVNAIAIGALLATLLLGNVMIELKPELWRRSWTVIGLLGSLLIAYLIPFRSISGSTRYVGSLVALTFAIPVFFAGLLFAEEFRITDSPSSALAANMLGAVCGGLLETLSLVAAMKLDGVYLLDREMDADHNRCVITLVGEREPIQEAAIRGVGKAAELIDLNVHQGAHPRMGAADVVPFVPIEGVTIEDCVAMARHVGEQIWKRYQIPVYLYEAAATIPERQNLESIRRGQFEGIRAEIATNPARKPDFGDPRVHPTAGATVVGARKFLIAYNIFLNTPDVEIAKKVAKAVRFSSGGMRFVKGAGFLVRGLAQVSMNLTDFDQTPIYRVFELVKREAARYGVIPVSSEIVGLIPKKALEQAAEWFLQIENFDSSLILENRLAAVMGGKMAVGGLRAGVEPFVEQLAASTATPGGGSAAAPSGAKEVAEIADKLKPITNPNMKSDLTTASALARAAIEGALANVDINLESLKDQGFVSEMRRKAGALKA